MRYIHKKKAKSTMKKNTKINRHVINRTNFVALSVWLIVSMAYVHEEIAYADDDEKEQNYKSNDSSVTFYDIAANDSGGINYRRTPSAQNEIWKSIKQQAVYGVQDIALTPTKPRGMPGVAVFDYDMDGDEDIYVTNGPGTPNSLYSNQYMETGSVSFIDVSTLAFVQATAQDSTGVCYGDIDNDGDDDLYVLGNNEENILFENKGNGTFSNIKASSGTGAGINVSSSCSFGDVNGDGYIDIVVANLFDNLDHRIPILSLEVDHLVQRDQLFINQGNGRFEDKSEESGVASILGISWAIALVDYDQDGDVDLFVGQDQGPRTPNKNGGRDAGVLVLMENDGKGNFTDVTKRVAGGRFGAWMSLAFGDLNSDGHLDFFASNAGEYFAEAAKPLLTYVPVIGDWSSGWFLGQKNKTFDFPGVGDLNAVPFGWGGTVVDYDNDGDLDIIYHGGWENGNIIDASNPGAILNNDGYANFTRDKKALKYSTDHARRTVQGVAIGDFNNDGFSDLVSVSSMNWPKEASLIPYFQNPEEIFGASPFNEAAMFMPTFTPVDPNDIFKGLTWNGIESENGTLSVEINSGNDNSYIKVKLLGAKGLISGGKVNRDGIGAIVTVVPEKGKPIMKPIVGGSSYASMESIIVSAGIGGSDEATVEVLWPGGTRNKIYNVRAGDSITFPELPCSYDTTQLTKAEYKICVRNAIDELVATDSLTPGQARKISKSAIKAYQKAVSVRNKNKITFSDNSSLFNFSHMTSGGEGHGGIAWLDYNNDGNLDAFMTNGFGHKNGLFKNNGDGTFTDVSEESGIENGLGNSGVLAGDIDNDGYTDLFLTSAGGLFTFVTPSPVKLYHNNGDGTFTDITDGAGITGLVTSWSAAFGDINKDGYLDLFISTPGSVVEQRQDRNKLFLNNGDLSFTDISQATGIDTAFGGCTVVFSDYDLDGDQDILLGNCNEINLGVVPIELFRNEGNLEFTNVTQQAGLTRLGAWMGFAIGDYDNDGDQDIFATNLGNFPGLSVLPVFYENNGDGTFSDVSDQVGISDNLFGWGATMTDFNNDGYVDLFYTGSFPFSPFNVSGSLASPGTLFINDRNKKFFNKNDWFGVDLSNKFSSGVATGDYNNDGFIDISIVSGSLSNDGSLTSLRIPGHPLLMENQGNKNYSLTIKTVGTESNSGGVGARVVVKAGDLIQTKEVRAGSSFLSTESPWLTFGLQKQKIVESIKIYWPSGKVENYRNIKSGGIVTIVEDQGVTMRRSYSENVQGEE